MNWSLFFTAFLESAWATKRKLVFALIAVALTGVTALLLEKPKYKTSWVMLLPGTERATSLSIDNLGEARSGGTNAYGSVSISPKNTYKEIALSNAVLDKAAAKFGVSPESFSKPKIKLIDQTPAMEFSLKGASNKELKDRAQIFNDSFHEVLDQLRQNEIERNYRGVEGSLFEAKKRLRDARAAIISYQAQSNLIADTQFNAWVNQLETVRSAKSLAEVELASLNARVESQIKQLGVSAEQATALLTFQGSPINQRAINLLSEKLAEEASLQVVFGSKNPARNQVIMEISGLEERIDQSLNFAPSLKNLQRSKLYGMFAKDAGLMLKELNDRLAELDSTREKISILEKQLSETEALIKAHTLKAATLSDLERDHQIAEAIFSSALAKLDTSRLDIYATYPLTQLLTMPGGTVKRDRLGIKLLLVALFLFYCLVSMGLILAHLRARIMMNHEAQIPGKTAQRQESHQEMPR